MSAIAVVPMRTRRIDARRASPGSFAFKTNLKPLFSAFSSLSSRPPPTGLEEACERGTLPA